MLIGYKILRPTENASDWILAVCMCGDSELESQHSDCIAKLHNCAAKFRCVNQSSDNSSDLVCDPVEAELRLRTTGLDFQVVHKVKTQEELHLHSKPQVV